MREQRVFLPFQASVYGQAFDLPDETWQNLPHCFAGFEPLIALLDQWPDVIAEAGKPTLPAAEIPTNDPQHERRVQFALDNL